MSSMFSSKSRKIDNGPFARNLLIFTIIALALVFIVAKLSENDNTTSNTDDDTAAVTDELPMKAEFAFFVEGDKVYIHEGDVSGALPISEPVAESEYEGGYDIPFVTLADGKARIFRFDDANNPLDHGRYFGTIEVQPDRITFTDSEGRTWSNKPKDRERLLVQFSCYLMREGDLTPYKPNSNEDPGLPAGWEWDPLPRIEFSLPEIPIDDIYDDDTDDLYDLDNADFGILVPYSVLHPYDFPRPTAEREERSRREQEYLEDNPKSK